ncbi:GDP-mannose 4,6-dehydratase [bacterium]|nr:GDP-mannose 4,6-dehydratase [bacterium]
MGEENFWENKRTLVTGCTGILGSWLTIALVDRRADTVGLVYDENPRSELVRSGYVGRITVLRGTVTDFELMERILNDFEIEVVFHLAAQALVTVANRNPLSTFEANIRGTWNVLEAARRSKKVERLVLASSDKAYGDQEILPYKEDAPLIGRHPYDVSKSCADMIALAYGHTYDLPLAITRCGNIYGGGDLHWDRIVPGTIRSAIRGERPVVRSDGTPKRDYIYVKDIVSGYLLLAEKLGDASVRGEAFNFGHDSPLTVLEIVREVLDAAGRSDMEPSILNKAKHEIHSQYLDSSKARRVLGWEPGFSLPEGLRETVAWYRRFFEEGK